MKHLILALILALAACGSSSAPAPIEPPPSPVQDTSAELATPCHYHGTGDATEPDPACTPGATSPAVTQANIHTTICVSGYTATVRPPVAFTNKLKLQQMTRYGVGGQATHGFEEDHLIPLEAGGSPTDPLNLWPEPNAARKDHLENRLHSMICAGQMQLADAQHQIATDWVKAAQGLGL